MKIIRKIFNNKSAKGNSFFDYSSKDKKKIVKEAAKESNRLQLELVKKYGNTYNLK